MKRNVFILALCLSLLVLFSCSKESTKPIVIDSNIYCITLTDFDMFLENPNIEFIKNNAEKKTLYEIVDDTDECIKTTVEANEETESHTSLEGWYSSISDLPIYKSFITFWSDIDMIESTLKANGINEKIQDLIIFETYSSNTIDIPLSAYIITEKNNYFITVHTDLSDSSDGKQYKYNVYNSNEYSLLYKKQKGNVYLNGEKTNNLDIIKFQGNGAFISLNNFADALDLESIFIADNKSFKITNGSKIVTIDVNSRDIFDNAGHEWFPFEKGPIYTIDGKIVVDNDAAQFIFDKLDINATIDYENKSISFWK